MLRSMQPHEEGMPYRGRKCSVFMLMISLPWPRRRGAHARHRLRVLCATIKIDIR